MNESADSDAVADDPADAAFTTDVQVRYNDIDEMGHVNNATYVTYLEQGRVDWFREGLGVRTLDEIEFVVAHLDVDYERPLGLVEDVTVALWVSDLGTKSFTVAYEIRDGDAVVVTAETVLVSYDRETLSPMAVPEDLRERLDAYRVRDDA